MAKRSVVDTFVNAVLVVSALSALFLLVHDRRRSQASRALSTTSASTIAAFDWDSLVSLARFDERRSASESRRVTLIEAIDVECPFCRDYAQTISRLQSDFGESLSVGFVHLPLKQHRFAQLGGRALECAHTEHRFPQLLSALLGGQDSIGLKPWADFAGDVGIHDVDAFISCMADVRDVPAVTQGSELNRRLGARGTPTVYLDGYMFSAPPDERVLRRVIERIIAGADARSALERERLLPAPVEE